jgi:hypothetical protein
MFLCNPVYIAPHNFQHVHHILMFRTGGLTSCTCFGQKKFEALARSDANRELNLNAHWIEERWIQRVTRLLSKSIHIW